MSKWDVSTIIDMEYMFHDVSAFKYDLCGVVWMNSKVVKTGSMVSTTCATIRDGVVVERMYKYVCFTFVGHDQNVLGCGLWLQLG